ncbi:hypothetical protein PMALA_036030 [Plasmodium malariae]|uniref:Uncharacterized protein n=1 Tax=Plasmodium malariae TaxID=5858 RepID=A0A1A8WJS6_PLAMA|nr:hypothetical protein PMALA_036030 [Plasmodium malariae]
MDSNISDLKKGKSKNGVRKKKYIFNNEKGATRKYEQSYRDSFYTKEYSKNTKKNPSDIPKTKKYCYIEKKYSKNLIVQNFLKTKEQLKLRDTNKLNAKK